jgi:hypothetical protein
LSIVKSAADLPQNLACGLNNLPAGEAGREPSDGSHWRALVGATGNMKCDRGNFMAVGISAKMPLSRSLG